ncbi:hypothetical protein EMA8858_00693 [Emticicia aquatica]|jgi:hypothetical protein|uniref:Uncharacterized protein n=1 Tax=Emticicia aquatica TaxID=1681835 RepID=A0ABM9ALF5_9BACT|nr:hypothetical protein EMA8858_00693 [Emticicia aquatica]
MYGTSYERKKIEKLSIKYKKCKKNIQIDCFVLVLSNKFVLNLQQSQISHSSKKMSS